MQNLPHAVECSDAPASSVTDRTETAEQPQTVGDDIHDEEYPGLGEYARSIGIDPLSEPDLLWIAREGYHVPLPPGWKAIPTEDGDAYFFHDASQLSSWEHPLDYQYREMVLQERQRTRNMQESYDNLKAARNADGAEPRFEDRLLRDLSPIFEHTEDTSRSNSSPQLSERSGAGTELEVLSTFSEDSRVEPFGQGISGRIEHEQGKNAGSSNWLDTRIQEQARIVIDKDLSGRIQEVESRLSERLSRLQTDVSRRSESPEEKDPPSKTPPARQQAVNPRFASMLARLDMQVDEVIRRNWTEYCNKCAHSYAHLAEVASLI